MNRETNNYELHMQVNLEFNKKKDDENNGEKRVHQKFTPGLQSERLRVIILINSKVVNSSEFPLFQFSYSFLSSESKLIFLRKC